MLEYGIFLKYFTKRKTALGAGRGGIMFNQGSNSKFIFRTIIESILNYGQTYVILLSTNYNKKEKLQNIFRLKQENKCILKIVHVHAMQPRSHVHSAGVRVPTAGTLAGGHQPLSLGGESRCNLAGVPSLFRSSLSTSYSAGRRQRGTRYDSPKLIVLGRIPGHLQS